MLSISKSGDIYLDIYRIIFCSGIWALLEHYLGITWAELGQYLGGQTPFYL